MIINRDYFIKLGFSEENAERSLFLYDIAKAVSAKDLVLKGGTSLLFGYGLNRYSTDLDFNTSKKTNHIVKIIEILRERNIHYNAMHDKKEGSRIITDILFKTGQRKDKLKIDIDYSGKYMNNEQNIINNNGIYMFNIETLCRMKYEAFLNRKKARDIFDVGYLIQHSPKSFDENMLKKIDERIKELGIDTIKKIFMKDDALKYFNAHEIIDKATTKLNALLNQPEEKKEKIRAAEKPGKKKKDYDYER